MPQFALLLILVLLPVCIENLDPKVVVMKSAQDGK
jgi:hypothetical protein